MGMMPRSSYKDKYRDEIKRRGAQSKVYRKYQLLGLEIAKALEDESRKSLYIKLAKLEDGDWLLRNAKEIAQKRNIKNKGAYFMSVIYALGKNSKTRKK